MSPELVCMSNVLLLVFDALAALKLSQTPAEFYKVSANPSFSTDPFVLLAANKNLFQVQQVSPSCSSWMIGSNISSDGSLYVLTPFDPIFLVIPLLEKSRNKARKHDSGKSDLNRRRDMMDTSASCLRLSLAIRYYNEFNLIPWTKSVMSEVF
jgi:hypothetical protein